MLSEKTSERIAREWLESWNSHDLESILSHYSEDIEFTSPFIVKLMGEKEGTILGKERLREYFKKGLAAYPELNFELINILTGTKSLTLYYRSVNNLLAAEVMVINKEDKISKVLAHYTKG